MIATKALVVNTATSKVTLRWAAPATPPSTGITWEILNSQSAEVSALPPAANVTTPSPKIGLVRPPSGNFINAVYTV